MLPVRSVKPCTNPKPVYAMSNWPKGIIVLLTTATTSSTTTTSTTTTSTTTTSSSTTSTTTTSLSTTSATTTTITTTTTTTSISIWRGCPTRSRGMIWLSDRTKLLPYPYRRGCR